MFSRSRRHGVQDRLVVRMAVWGHSETTCPQAHVASFWPSGSLVLGANGPAHTSLGQRPRSGRSAFRRAEGPAQHQSRGHCVGAMVRAFSLFLLVVSWTWAFGPGWYGVRRWRSGSAAAHSAPSVHITPLVLNGLAAMLLAALCALMPAGAQETAESVETAFVETPSPETEAVEVSSVEPEPSTPGERLAPPSASSLPETLDAAIAEAMSGNPDIALAEANLLAASAELRRTRMEVVQQVTDSYQTLERSRSSLERANQMYKDGLLGYPEWLGQQQQAEKPVSELRYLLGKGVPGEATPARGGLGTKPFLGGLSSDVPGLSAKGALLRYARPTMPDGMTELLEKATDIEFEDTSPMEFLSLAADIYGCGVVLDAGVVASASIVTYLNMSQVPFEQALLAVTDATGGRICFVIRDYGILATTPERAMEIYAPTIPADIPVLASVVPEE